MLKESEEEHKMKGEINEKKDKGVRRRKRNMGKKEV